MIFYLAGKAIELYTQIIPPIVYSVTNALLAKGYETKFEILYPFVSLIDLGITNYYDISGSLSVAYNQHNEMEKVDIWRK